MEHSREQKQWQVPVKILQFLAHLSFDSSLNFTLSNEERRKKTYFSCNKKKYFEKMRKKVLSACVNSSIKALGKAHKWFWGRFWSGSFSNFTPADLLRFEKRCIEEENKYLEGLEVRTNSFSEE